MLILIDNYDSFTYNLVHYFEEIGQSVKVFRNNEITVEKIFKLKPRFLVISPGPSSPKNSGICLELIKKNSELPKTIPMLGVCLGHQAIAEAFGGTVIQSGKPVHGKVSKIYHENTKLFRNIDNPFNATRYHSLIEKKIVFQKILILLQILKMEQLWQLNTPWCLFLEYNFTLKVLLQILVISY